MHTYSLLDFGNHQRLEQWGKFRLIRPDPTALGLPKHPEVWQSADARYSGEKGKGEWITATPMPPGWQVAFDDIALVIRLAPYKHTGAFPEQQQNWRWMRAQARRANRPLRILNLFAYTGGATMALAKDGHHVTHVDSSKPTIGWAKENAALNQLPDTSVRWMLEDAAVFASREVKRGKFYDGIILDPPPFGHSPTGSTWRVERDLAPLLEDCARLLSEQPSFIVLNSYAKNQSPESFHRLLTGILKTKAPGKTFDIMIEDLPLCTEDGRELSTGLVVRVSFGNTASK